MQQDECHVNTGLIADKKILAPLDNDQAISWQNNTSENARLKHKPLGLALVPGELCRGECNSYYIQPVK
jgi:hypothetical protein